MGGSFRQKCLEKESRLGYKAKENMSKKFDEGENKCSLMQQG